MAQIDIGGRLHSTATGNVVTGANEILDDTLNKKQNEVNDISVNQTYRKSETYNKEELNQMITTPNQEFVSVSATSETTSITDILPAEGEKDTIYRVGNWDGTAYTTDCYTEYAWDGSDYVPLSTKEPGIDDKPIPNSDNLVKSGGVAGVTDKLTNTNYLLAGCKGNVFDKNYVRTNKTIYNNQNGAQIANLTGTYITAYYKIPEDANFIHIAGGLGESLYMRFSNEPKDDAEQRWSESCGGTNLINIAEVIARAKAVEGHENWDLRYVCVTVCRAESDPELSALGNYHLSFENIGERNYRKDIVKSLGTCIPFDDSQNRSVYIPFDFIKGKKYHVAIEGGTSNFVIGSQYIFLASSASENIQGIKEDAIFLKGVSQVISFTAEVNNAVSFHLYIPAGYNGNLYVFSEDSNVSEDLEVTKQKVDKNEDDIAYIDGVLFKDKETPFSTTVDAATQKHCYVSYDFKKNTRYKVVFEKTLGENNTITNVSTVAAEGSPTPIDILGDPDNTNRIVFNTDTVEVDFVASNNAAALHYFSNYDISITITVKEHAFVVEDISEKVDYISEIVKGVSDIENLTTKNILFSTELTQRKSVYVRLPWEMLPGHKYKFRLALGPNSTRCNIGVMYFGYYDDYNDGSGHTFNIEYFRWMDSDGVIHEETNSISVNFNTGYREWIIVPTHKLTHFHYFANENASTSGIDTQTPTIMSVSETVINNYWAGKKVVWLGTSVPFGAGTLEDDPDKRTSYPYMASKALGFNLVPAFVPGLGIQAYKDGNELVYPHIYGSSCLSKAEYAAAISAGILKVERTTSTTEPVESDYSEIINLGSNNFPNIVVNEVHTPAELDAVELHYPTGNAKSVAYYKGSAPNYTIWTISKFNFPIQDTPIYYTPGGSSNHYYCTWENIFTEENADTDLWVFDILPNNRVYEYDDWNAFGKNTDKSQWAYTDDSSFEDHRFTCIGALLFLLDKLYTLNPKARVVLWRGSNHGYNEAKDNLETVAAKWNIPIVDIFKKLNTIPIKNPETNNLYVYGDGGHPSALGQEILGRYAIRELMNLGG